MADISSDIYKYAINTKLSDGLIRGLKADLKEFKGLWREETYQAARNLSRTSSNLGGRFRLWRGPSSFGHVVSGT